MSGLVFPFARARRSSDWSAQELAEFYRVEAALLQAGLLVETERGTTDEGEPWFAFCRAEDGEVIVHLARLGSEYVLAGPAYEGVAYGRDLRSLVQDLVSRHPMIRLDGRKRSGSNVMLHPAALLVAVVATAFLKSGEANAMGADHNGQPAKDGLAALRSSWLLAGGPASAVIDKTSRETSDGVDAAHTAVVMSAVLTVLNTADAEQLALKPQVQNPSTFVQTAHTESSHFAALDGLTAQPMAAVALHSTSSIDLTSPEGSLFDGAPHQAIASTDGTAALAVIVMLGDLAKAPTSASVAAFDAHIQDLGGFPFTTHAFEAAPIPMAAQAPDRPTVVLGVSAVDGGLPKVIAGTLLASDGIAAQLTPDQISHVDKLPDIVTASLQSSAHTVVDLTQLQISGIVPQAASNTSSSSTVIPDQHPGAVADNSTEQPAGDPGGHVSAPAQIDVTAAVRAFMADTPNYKVITTNSDVVIYDAYTMSKAAAPMYSVTWDFADGSTLSLIGTAGAVHDAAVHGGIG